jgi:hypothetical protein
MWLPTEGRSFTGHPRTSFSCMLEAMQLYLPHALSERKMEGIREGQRGWRKKTRRQYRATSLGGGEVEYKSQEDEGRMNKPPKHNFAPAETTLPLFSSFLPTFPFCSFPRIVLTPPPPPHASSSTQIYHVADTPFALIGTSEISCAGLLQVSPPPPYLSFMLAADPPPPRVSLLPFLYN